MVTGPIVDDTGSSPVNMTTGPLGDGVNLFDVTDISLSLCSNNNPGDVLSNAAGAYILQLGMTSSISNVSGMRLYLGEAENCTANSFSFGTAPTTSQFFIDQFFLSSIGEVGAQLRVPSSWGSSTQLNNEFRLDWYLRRNDHIIQLVTNTRSLALNTNTTAALNITNPGDWYLEARILRVDTGSWTSTTSRDYNHDLTYEVVRNQVTYQRSEQNFVNGTSLADDFLDPGEILNAPVRIIDPNSGSVTAAELASGYVVDRNGNGQIDLTLDSFVTGDLLDPTTVNFNIQSPANGTTNTFLLPFELLNAPVDAKVWFFVDSPGNHSGTPATSSTFRKYIALSEVSSGLNTDDSEVVTQFDFSQNNGGWSAVNQTPGLGWSYVAGAGTGRWVGNGGTLAAHGDDLNSIVSPALEVGRSGRLVFDHDPDFTFNQSGGILEYSFDGTNWQNLGQGCPSCDIQYDPIPFPDNMVSHLSGEPVWMGTPPDGNNRHLEDFVIPDSIFSGHSQVQFRFLFQDPSLNPIPNRSSGPTHWEISQLSWSTFQFLDDNIFGVDLDQLTLSDCDGVAELVFLDPPVSVSAMTFKWYESQANLYNDISVTGSQVVPFTPATNDVRYFVRVRFTHPSTAAITERVFQVRMINWVNCGPNCVTPDEALTSVLQDVSLSWPFGKSVLECIQIINHICPPQ